MKIDLTKLNHLRDKGSEQIAQCPACAATGHDSTGEHLIIYADGKYGCVAHPKDKAHRKEIFRLVGTRDGGSPTGPIPVCVRKPLCLTRTPRILLVLNALTAAKGPVCTTAEVKTAANSCKPGEAAGVPAQGGAPGDNIKLVAPVSEASRPEAHSTELPRSETKRAASGAVRANLLDIRDSLARN
jgi:hypothetical protein